MKKTMLLMILCLAWGMAWAAPTITVTSPAQGVTWACGQTHTILWTPTGNMDNRVKILLRQGGSLILTINGDTANDGTYSWPIPDSVTPGSYYIRVKTADNAVTGDSAAFTIVPTLPPPPPPPPSLTILFPNDGSPLVLLSQQVIRWKAFNVQGQVRLELVKNNGPVLGIIATNLDANAGSLPWAAGKYGINQTAPAGVYRVVVRSLSDLMLTDQSDQPFTLKLLMTAPHEPIALPKPDLVACTETAVYVPLKTMGLFHVYVRNVGQGTAKAPFDVEICMAGSTPQRITMNTDLGPGQTRWVVNIGNSKMTHFTIGFQVNADPDNVVAESNEDNNRASGLLFIEEGNPTYNTPIRCGDKSTVEGN